MTTTPNLVLPEIAAAQAQKHVTHNEALRLLDAVVQLAVLDRDLTAPPGAPAAGDRYIVGPSATGAWAGQDGNVAAYIDGAWSFLVPSAGWTAFAVDEAALLYHNGAAWTPTEWAPRRSFSANLSANQTGIAANVATKVNFDTEAWDTGGVFDTVTGRFTPTAGNWRVSAVMHVLAVEDTRRIAAHLYRNGGPYRSNYESISGTANQNGTIDVLIQADGTEYFEIYVTAEGSGGTKTVHSAGSLSWFAANEV